MKLASFAAGCFWGVEEAFLSSGLGVKTVCGYAGGQLSDPTYKQVCTGNTGHAETVQIEYDPNTVKYKSLLTVFWRCHDPTTVNRQGPDIGTQYRSAIFYHDDEQRIEAEASLQEEQTKHAPRKIVTEIKPAGTFYPAEDYHQQYLRKHGGASCHF